MILMTEFQTSVSSSMGMITPIPPEGDQSQRDSRPGAVSYRLQNLEATDADLAFADLSISEGYCMRCDDGLVPPMLKPHLLSCIQESYDKQVVEMVCTKGSAEQ